MRRRALGLAIAAALGACVATAATGQDNSTAQANPREQAKPRDGRGSETAPVTVKISTDRPLSIANASPSGPTWLSTLLSALPAVVALIGSLIVVRLGNRQSEKNTMAALNVAATNAQVAINQKANELEIGRIEKWLSDFFGPFMQLSEENKRIAGLLRSRQTDPSFRTLRALLDPEWKKSASKTDLNLINRIVGTGIALRTLIREKAGPTSPALSEYLSRAAAHFTILELADAGALTERTEDFDQYVYPRQLDAVLNLERERLEARRDMLLSNLAERHAAAPALVIPPELALDKDLSPS